MSTSWLGGITGISHCPGLDLLNFLSQYFPNDQCLMLQKSRVGLRVRKANCQSDKTVVFKVHVATNF
jgi:hypothetical protein